jgi:hypothetical protein
VTNRRRSGRNGKTETTRRQPSGASTSEVWGKGKKRFKVRMSRRRKEKRTTRKMQKEGNRITMEG